MVVARADFDYVLDELDTPAEVVEPLSKTFSSMAPSGEFLRRQIRRMGILCDIEVALANMNLLDKAMLPHTFALYGDSLVVNVFVQAIPFASDHRLPFCWLRGPSMNILVWLTDITESSDKFGRTA